MKKSVIAIATAAAVASSTILTPVAFAQSFVETVESVTPIDPVDVTEDGVRPPMQTQDGDRSTGCFVEWHAGAVWDPRFDDAPNDGFSYKVKGPHTDGGEAVAINKESQGTLVAQHYTASNRVHFRIILGVDAEIKDAVLEFDLSGLPAGKDWVVSESKPISGYKSGISYMSETHSDFDEQPVGYYDADAQKIIYELGDLKPMTGTVLFFTAGPLTAQEIRDFTAPIDGTFSNAFGVHGVLTGEFEPGWAQGCAPEGAYDDSFTTPGQDVTVNLNGEASFPEDTTFAVELADGNPVVIGTGDDGLEYNFFDWKTDIDESTGRLVVTPPADTKNGVYTVTVIATTPNGDEYEIPARIHVTNEANLDFDPAYDDSFTTPGQNVIVNLNGEAGVPEGSTFEVTDAPEGWTVAVDENGQVIAEPPTGTKPGVYDVVVTITTPAGEEVKVPARIHVQGEPDITMVIGYRDEDGNFIEGVAPEGTVPGHIVTIIKADGTKEQYFIPNGQDGEDGTSASVVVIPETRDGVTGNVVITFIDADGDNKYTEGVDEKISEAFVPNGQDGADGEDGRSSKVEVVAGVKDGKTGYWIVTYFDGNGDGDFTENEIISREFVTDGKAASATVTPTVREGVNGNVIVTFYDEDGDGKYAPGVDILVSEAFVPNPRNSKVVVEEGDGGNWIITFFDANGDGEFTAAEEVDRQFVPNGVDGKDGLNTDVRVVKGQDELGNPGTWIYTYVDANGDGEFTEDERTGAQFVADGKDAPATTIKLEKGDGGTWVVTYVDKNGDGEFTADEEVAREFVADGKDGETPVIGENGNWFIGGEDTGVPARGQDGRDGQTPVIGENGNWFIGGKDTGVKASCDCAPGKDGKDGEDGKSITIVDQGLTEEGDVWVEFSDGTRIVIPSGKDAETNPEEQGVQDPKDAGSSANERCLPAALTVGAPLLALLPLGLIGQLDLPIARQFNAQMAAANTEIQKALGIFNGNNARTASALNGQMAQFGQIGGMVGGALIGIAVIGLITKFLVDNCKPVAEGEESGSFALPEDYGNSSN